jgi:hypothetical protein
VNAGTLSYVTVSPTSATIVAGSQQAFISIAHDTYGNDIGTVTSSTSWTITSGAGGSWVQSIGTYTSQNVGTWMVTATYSGQQATSSLTVTAATGYSVSVTLISPINSTYTSSSVPLSYTSITNCTGLWIGYSLNGATNITLSGNTTLTGLANGAYTLTLYANNTQGSVTSYSTAFAVNVPSPSSTPKVTQAPFSKTILIIAVIIIVGASLIVASLIRRIDYRMRPKRAGFSLKW